MEVKSECKLAVAKVDERPSDAATGTVHIGEMAKDAENRALVDGPRGHQGSSEQQSAGDPAT